MNEPANPFDKKDLPVPPTEHTEESAPDALTEIWNKHGRAISFIGACVIVVIALVMLNNQWAQGYLQSAYEIVTDRSVTIEKMEDAAKQYAGTAAEPLVLFRLADVYLENDRASDAVSLFERIVKEHAGTDYAQWAEHALPEARKQVEWKAGEDKLLRDLDDRHKAAAEQYLPPEEPETPDAPGDGDDAPPADEPDPEDGTEEKPADGDAKGG
jgi:hypothetical protein